MAKEEGFDKYKVTIAAVAGCVLVAIVLCIMLTQGPGQQKDVVFSKHGVPHCPYCQQIVMPFTDYCDYCKRSFRWTNTIIKCYRCNGSAVCAACLGIGKLGVYEVDTPIESGKCWECSGKRKCPVCKGEGWLRYGMGSVEYYDRRK